MNTNNGWPGKPGVPLNPEQDGWHWVESAEGPVPALWARPLWRHCRDFWDQRSPEWMEEQQWRHLGPCLTPTEVEARFSEAMKWRTAIYDALTEWHDPPRDDETSKAALRRLVHTEILAALDPAVSRPAADLVAQARRDALEEAAREIDCGCDIRAAVLERLECQGERKAGWLCPKGDACCALQSAAIRALKGEGDE